MATKYDSLVDAVMNEDRAQVEALIDRGAPLEEKDHRGQTPLVIAAVTDQFRIAEILLQAGADPFAVDKFGWTAGYAAQTSALARGPEFEAKARFEAMLTQRGYPMPGPDKPEIKQMVADGNWPPAEWGIAQ
jgi:uncharacterized protein